MKAYIETYGCTANMVDSSGICDAILRSGGSVVDDPGEADVIIINTCAVTQHTSRSMLKAISKYNGKRVIVAGCMASAQPEMLTGLEFAKKPGADHVAKLLGIAHDPNEIPLTMTGKTAIISISEGCMGNCSYCIVRIARGKLRSERPEKILDAVKRSVAAGATELYITSQDVGTYGMDIGIRLHELLREIIGMPGDFKIRLGMMNPFSIADIIPEMIDVFNHPKVYKFAHIPVQSGSDRILGLMGRPYTAAEYRGMVEELRGGVPGITFSTDYIVGFPTETDDDFERTKDNLRVCRPLKVNITRYSPRPGTPAAMMPDVLERIKKERSRALTALHHEVTSSFMRSCVGEHKGVLVTEPGKAGTVVARDSSYNMVVIGELLPQGKYVDVEIIDARTTYMVGKVIR
ncbi:2-methylthioadenine synthetase [Methanocella sp. CWC-04]|uniref:tRNA-t(6)A37 methylthiotransferase n=1 Tax=Methanooceanicella nereidis TaxID=2052831 RepID=A0AAP2W8N5_9EURY|nr:tRNA (N(6)-L-threonylcarbamoyladenosine(37)-C(2))-methylthiotransferase [Methanocella sp. CWC-04]MCD1296201.1 2-methylthioadenine synthetase [Methanocella sp. CWC-04]